tara:strand:- start:690 stop:1160 length:471 start_codon:yes stop_codon:yes gene_type:complete
MSPFRHYEHQYWDIRFQILANYRYFLSIKKALLMSSYLWDHYQIKHPSAYILTLIEKYDLNRVNESEAYTTLPSMGFRWAGVSGAFLKLYPEYMDDAVIEELCVLNNKYVSLVNELSKLRLVNLDGTATNIISRNGIIRKNTKHSTCLEVYGDKIS